MLVKQNQARDDRKLPAPVGTRQEAAEIARVIGNPSALTLTCSDIERELISTLIWREE